MEFSAVRFIGYTGERLIMLVMRDISQRKSYENELLQFNTSIENILSQKISELEASEVMRQKLSRQLNSLKMQLGHYHKADKMVGSSRRMRELREMIHQVAGSDATITITGESGTGKELVANLVQATSGRDDKPFLEPTATPSATPCSRRTCSATKKAPSPAPRRKIGKFEVVDGGTIFLDEIGDISPHMQVSLLRALQNGEIIRVGGNEPVQVDVRVIAATNVDLAQAVKDKKFGSTSTTGSTSSPSTSPLRERRRTSSSWSTTLSTTTAPGLRQGDRLRAQVGDQPPPVARLAGQRARAGKPHPAGRAHEQGQDDHRG